MKIFISFLFIFAHVSAAETLLTCTPLSPLFPIQKAVITKEEDQIYAQSFNSEGRMTQVEVSHIEWLDENINLAAPAGEITAIYGLKKFGQDWFFLEENLDGNIIHKKSNCF